MSSRLRRRAGLTASLKLRQASEQRRRRSAHAFARAQQRRSDAEPGRK